MEVDIWVDDGEVRVACEPLEPAVHDFDLGPGWFESSHELKLGLWICEMDTAAAASVDGWTVSATVE